MAKKNKSSRYHVVYNKKIFLAPDSINSMSAIHTKLLKDGTAIVRLSDCHNSIKWWNDMNNSDEVQEMLTKLDNAIIMLTNFRNEVIVKSKNIIQ